MQTATQFAPAAPLLVPAPAPAVRKEPVYGSKEDGDADVLYGMDYTCGTGATAVTISFDFLFAPVIRLFGSFDLTPDEALQVSANIATLLSDPCVKHEVRDGGWGTGKR